MKTIGIFGPPSDQEVKALADRLAHRGVTPWIVDLSEFPQNLRISFGSKGVLIDDRSILEMDAAYVRRVGFSLPAHARYDAIEGNFGQKAWQALYEETAQALQRERKKQAVRQSVVEQLALKRPVINPPESYNLHRLKGLLMRRLGRAKLPVPQFSLGSDCGRLADFARQGKEKWTGVVDKPPAGIYKTHLWTEDRQGTHPWTARPAFYQRFIRGDTVRCFVVEGKLISAARIVHGGTVDSSMSQTGIEVIELPEPARGIAEKVATTLELPFCGMDLMLDESTKEAFVIDCNMSPMFVNYGRLSRCDIAGHLAELLIKIAHGEPYRRPEVMRLLDEAKGLLANDKSLAELLGKGKIRKRG